MIKFLDLKAVNQLHQAEIDAAVSRVVHSGWYLLGEENRQFEECYAQYVGTHHCIGVGNGLDALRLIIRGYKELGVFHDGDEVIVPANTYIATIIAITDSGLTPVLVEPTWDDLELDISLVEQAITAKTKAVLTVHLYGRIAYGVIYDQNFNVRHERVNDLAGVERLPGSKYVQSNLEGLLCVH